jgi:hypothetical protein
MKHLQPIPQMDSAACPTIIGRCTQSEWEQQSDAPNSAQDTEQLLAPAMEKRNQTTPLQDNPNSPYFVEHGGNDATICLEKLVLYFM